MRHHQTPAVFMKLTMVVSTLLFLGLTQGCVDLKAVQDFANISAESAEYTTLVDNYMDFPQRQKRYQSEDRHAQLEAMAQERLTQQTELLLRHNVIEEYMEALGRLAADEIVDQSEELSQLTTKLQNQAGTSPAETEAFGKIAGVLTNAIGDKWRKRQIQELIERSNDPFQIIVNSLKQIVVEGFGGDDQNERFAIQSYYRTKIAQSSDPAGIAALMEWQEHRENHVAGHTDTIQAYAAILEKISAGHQQLYDGRNDLSKDQLIQSIKKSAKELKDILSSIKKI
ncbi:MAG: hypothetical protein OEZ57_06810 [Nitrospirota bacterium]|nr:hypothetical protein [Nitrospirota bacterium]